MAKAKTARKLIGVWLCAGLLLIAAAGPFAGDARARRTYRIATVAWMGWSPLHVAQEKGFWARRGLDVQVINYDDPTVVLEAVSAGRIDFAMDMAGSLVGLYLRGTHLVILAETDWSDGGDKLIIEAGIRMRDLVGQPVGVFLDMPSCLFFLDSFLVSQGLSLDQFRVVEIGAQDLAAQFTARRIPAIVIYEPWANLALKGRDSKVLATSADYPGCIPECLWASRGRIDEIPATDLEKLIAGWIDAALWVNDPQNWDEFTTILNRKTFPGNEIPEAELRAMANNVRIHDLAQLWERNRTGGGLEDYLARLKAFLKRNSRLTKDFSSQDIFDNRHVLNALRNYPD